MSALALTCRFEPSEWLAAWREETGRLFLPTDAAPKLRQTVAVDVQLSGRPVGATVVGTVVGVQRHLTRHRVEIAPDEESRRAAGLLSAAARGEPVQFRERAPRYRVRIPVVVCRGGAGLYLNTTSVSEGGCALRWTGMLPSVGQVLALRFGVGLHSVELRGVVRWRKASAASPAVGVRLDPGAAAGGWASLLAAAIGSAQRGA